MAQETFTPQKDPPEGSREVIDRELARQASGDKQQGGAPAPGASERPGDQAYSGTAGTGENVCPECSGTGKVNGHPCDQCRGTGKVVTGIGGG
jgi:RecJ-like exonuclease